MDKQALSVPGSVKNIAEKVMSYAGKAKKDVGRYKELMTESRANMLKERLAKMVAGQRKMNVRIKNLEDAYRVADRAKFGLRMQGKLGDVLVRKGVNGDMRRILRDTNKAKDVLNRFNYQGDIIGKALKEELDAVKKTKDTTKRVAKNVAKWTGLGAGGLGLWSAIRGEEKSAAYVEGFSKASADRGVDPVMLAKSAGLFNFMQRGFNAMMRHVEQSLDSTSPSAQGAKKNPFSKKAPAATPQKSTAPAGKPSSGSSSVAAKKPVVPAKG